MNKSFVAVLGACALLFAGCGSVGQVEGASSTTASAVATTTTEVLTKYEKFAAQLRGYGIYPTDDQLPMLVPAANSNCDSLASMTVPDDQKFEKMTELSMQLAKMQGKTWLQERPASEAFLRASVEAYCPELTDLLPAA